MSWGRKKRPKGPRIVVPPHGVPLLGQGPSVAAPEAPEDLKALDPEYWVDSIDGIELIDDYIAVKYHPLGHKVGKIVIPKLDSFCWEVLRVGPYAWFDEAKGDRIEVGDMLRMTDRLQRQAGREVKTMDDITLLLDQNGIPVTDETQLIGVLKVRPNVCARLTVKQRDMKQRALENAEKDRMAEERAAEREKAQAET